jgi:hypothetical protein
MRPLFEQNEEGMFMGFEIARYEGEREPVAVYFSELDPFDPTDLASSFGESIALYTAGPTGDVFVAPMTDSEVRVTGYTADGDQFLEIERNVDRVRKTDEEIQEEKTLVEERMIAGGMPPEMANWNPPPYRLAVGGLGVDDEGRLWVIRGTYGVPYCEVYDASTGDQLFTVAVDQEMDDADRLQLLITESGILAFDANPEYYPRLYIMEMQ